MAVRTRDGKRERKIEAVDLFSGVGGLAYGLKKAGVDVLAGIDNDASCAYAFEKNNGAEFLCADISSLDFSQIRDRYSKDAIRVMVGCAPCQPFSSHSYKQRKAKKRDGRWNLLDHFMRGIREVLPDVVSMENVPGVVETDVFGSFVGNLEKLDYRVDYGVVYAPDYGVPQNRRRLILLASRLGDIRIPKSTHSKENYTTVSDTIRRLSKISAGETDEKDSLHQAKRLTDINLKRIRRSKPGGTWKDWDKRLLPECYRRETGGSYTSVYGRMRWDDVSPTITTQFTNYGSGRFGHPDQDRALSLREGALLQTFPESYDFGKLSGAVIGRQIGNAVPPRLGYVIGRAISNHVRAYVG